MPSFPIFENQLFENQRKAPPTSVCIFVPINEFCASTKIVIPSISTPTVPLKAGRGRELCYFDCASYVVSFVYEISCQEGSPAGESGRGCITGHSYSLTAALNLAERALGFSFFSNSWGIMDFLVSRATFSFSFCSLKISFTNRSSRE